MRVARRYFFEDMLGIHRQPTQMPRKYGASSSALRIPRPHFPVLRSTVGLAPYSVDATLRVATACEGNPLGVSLLARRRQLAGDVPMLAALAGSPSEKPRALLQGCEYFAIRHIPREQRAEGSSAFEERNLTLSRGIALINKLLSMWRSHTSTRVLYPLLTLLCRLVVTQRRFDY